LQGLDKWFIDSNSEKTDFFKLNSAENNLKSKIDNEYFDIKKYGL